MPDIDLLIERWRRRLFQEDHAGRSRIYRFGIFIARLAHGIALKFLDGQLNKQASSLAYTTLLSLVPLLAVTFSVLKGFGVQNQLEPMLMNYLEPMGQPGLEAGSKILDFVNNLQVGVLGSLGIALLFYTVLSLLQKIEEAFNQIWRTPLGRSWARRFSDYLSVILVGPVFLFAGLSISVSALNNEWVQNLAAIEPFGLLIFGLGRLLPYLLICLTFAFMYAFLTNTRVQLMPALIGGVFAGALWFAIGLIFAKFVANSSSYSAIYSGFAAAVLFVIWVNVGWLIVLVGAQVACYWQNPHWLIPRGPDGKIGGREQGALALTVMLLAADAHYHRTPPWSLDRLAGQCEESPREIVAEMVDLLRDKGLLVASDDQPPFYLPAHDIGTIRLWEIVMAVREQGETEQHADGVSEVMNRIDGAIEQALRDQTLKDLVLAEKSGEA
ncbi:MAG: YihY/virulence factor BrkB family protein [Candidatus Competibacteraceae bacterium]|nr:YihY/virulence factor BrkB family protein [Candidatus Competibacteraceae bacterium]